MWKIQKNIEKLKIVQDIDFSWLNWLFKQFLESD